MEWPSFGGQHGVLRLPPGFRFHPTDEELVVEYLRRKVLRCPLPAAVIPEINLGKYVDPWDLPGGSHGERYFFSPGEAKRPLNGGRSSNSRATCSGYWKIAGKETPVMASSQRNMVVGVKKVLVFHRGKHPRGSPTDWIMHEYRLVAAAAAEPGEAAAPGFAPKKKSLHGYEMSVPKTQSCTGQTEDWVVCRIFRKRSKETEPNRNRLRNDAGGAARVGSEGAAAAQPSSSSGSSCITDDASDEGEGCSSGYDVASSPCGENVIKM